MGRIMMKLYLYFADAVSKFAYVRSNRLLDARKHDTIDQVRHAAENRIDPVGQPLPPCSCV